MKGQSLIQSLQNLVIISLWSYWLPDSVVMKYCWIFFLWFVFQNSISHISGIIVPIDVKLKKNGHLLDTGYVTFNFDLTHDLDLEFFKVKFLNNCISGIVGLIDVKQIESWLIKILDFTRHQWIPCVKDQ